MRRNGRRPGSHWGAETNQYTYVNGNPLNLSDPDGHRPVNSDGSDVPYCEWHQCDHTSDSASSATSAANNDLYKLQMAPLQGPPKTHRGGDSRNDLYALQAAPLVDSPAVSNPSPIPSMYDFISRPQPGRAGGPVKDGPADRPGYDSSPRSLLSAFRAFFNPMDTAEKARILVLGGFAKGWKNASLMLDHWLNNTGDDYIIDVSSVMAALPSFRNAVQRYVNHHQSAVRYDSGWSGTRADERESLDWYYSLNHFQWRVTGGNVRGFKWTRVQIYKRYDFGTPDDPRNPIKVPSHPFPVMVVEQSDLSKLNTQGIASDYDAYGSYSVWN